MSDQPIMLDDVKRLKIQPGEVLIVNLGPRHVEPDRVAQIREVFAQYAIPVIITSGGVKLTVVTPPVEAP